MYDEPIEDRPFTQRGQYEFLKLIEIGVNGILSKIINWTEIKSLKCL